MARTVSAPERTLLGSGKLNFHLKIEVQNGSGTWKDLTNLGGTNWINSWRIEENVDTRLMNLVVECKGRHGNLNLNPLMASSTLNRDDLNVYSPLVHPGRGIRVSEAVTDPGAAPVTWHVLIEGIQDEPDSTDDGEKITIASRDIGRHAEETQIEADDLVYSDAAGQPVETIIQQILNDHLGALAPTVVLPAGSPGWMIRSFTLARVKVMEAVVALTDQIGWDQRMRFPAVGNSMEWHVYPVDRANTTPNFTLPPDEYLTVRSLKFSDRDIRNVIRVYFKNRLNGNAIEYAEATDPASIAVFGRRYMEIREDSASNIDTPTEAQAMADAVRDDLSTPMADFSIETFGLWFVQLGDLVDFPANSVHYDSGQKFAVVNITRYGDGGKSRIILQTRGKVTGQYLAWLKKQGDGRINDDDLPRPQFGQPVGEDSEGGGVSGDGMVWLDFTFDKPTKEIRVFAEEAEDQYPPVPDISEITTAWRIVRPEGTETSKDNWSGMLGFATRPFWYKRLRAFGINHDGIIGPDTVFDIVQAIDLVAVIDGEVTNVVLTQTAIENVLDIDVGNTDPVVPSWLMVMRNGIIVGKIFLGFQNNTTINFIDSGYRGRCTYRCFIWTNGVTGAHFENTDLSNPPIFTLPVAGKLKITAMQVMDLSGVPALRIDYKANVVGFATAVLEESDDNGVGDPWAPSVVVSQNVGHFNGSFWVANVATPRYYRVRVDKFNGSAPVYSPVVFWNAVNIPPTTGPTPPQFVNGTPKLVWQTFNPEVEIEYDISSTTLITMRLETSADGITGWTEIDSDTSQHGLFYDSNFSKKFYRLRAVTSGGDLYSLPAFFPGFKSKPGGTTPGVAPVFTLTIAQMLSNGIYFPVLRISWTCADTTAVQVSIERSVDDGATDPWTEVWRDGQVAAGFWDTSAFDSYYYRMKALDSAGATLATSASQQYVSTVYFP